jgi:translocator protein
MHKTNHKNSFWKLIIAISLCQVVGIVSGLISQTEMNTWFVTINKPSWNPPSYLFAPVWATLYLLMGISLWLVWKSEAFAQSKKMAIIIFSSQLVFNFLWSILFFKFHSPALALMDIALMVVTIVITIFRFYSISKFASWLLIPYLFWVCFATVLNYCIWMLNK